MMNQLEYEDIQRYFKVLKAKKKANNLEQIERLEKIFQNIVEKQLPVKIKGFKNNWKRSTRKWNSGRKNSRRDIKLFIRKSFRVSRVQQ